MGPDAEEGTAVIKGAVAERDPGGDDGSDRWDPRSARGGTMRVRAEAGRARRKREREAGRGACRAGKRVLGRGATG